MAPRTRAAEVASKLDPTALEQTGLDPQQIQKQIDAAVRQAAAQTQTSSAPSTTSSAPSTTSSSSPGSSSPPPTTPPPPPPATSASGSSAGRRGPWELDPTYLEQTGLDPQQIQKQIDAAVRQTRSTISAESQASSTQPPGDSGRRPSVVDAVRSLDPAVADPSAVEEFYKTVKNIQLSEWKSGGPPRQDAPQPHVPADYVLYQRDPPDFSKLLDASALVSALRKLSDEPPPSYFNTSNTLSSQPLISVDYLLDQRNPVNIVNRLSIAFDTLKRELEETVSRYGDVLTYDPNASRVDVNPQLQGLLDKYYKALEELRKSLPDLQKTMEDMFGGYVVVSDGRVDLAPEVKALIDRANEFALLYNSIQQNYNSALFDLVKRYNLKVENNTLVFDFDRVKPELEAVKQEYNRRVEDLIRKYMQRDKDGNLVADPSVLDKAKAELEEINQWYGSAVNSVLNKYNLKVTDDGYIVFDYDKVEAELDALNRKHSEALDKLYASYGDLFNKRVVDGKVVYELKPEAQAALVLQNQIAQTVSGLAAAQQQALENVLGKYGDVLAYDPETRQVRPSKELQDMITRYTQAVQEVGRLTSTLSAVAGMLQTSAQQLPLFTVRFQTYDKATNQFVETGGETPIYVRDEKMREEILDWMSRNRDKFDVVALHDPNSRGRPYVVYIFNKETKEGYVIDPIEGTGLHVKGTEEGWVLEPTTGERKQLRGIDLYLHGKSLDIWHKSLTNKEREELNKWLEVLQRKERIEQMPPVARELYAALMGAGQFAVISPAVDVLARWLRGEDPTKGIERFEVESATAAQASPLAHAVGQAVGAIGIGGLAAEALIARGAAAGAKGVGGQLLAGLKSSLKPTVAGTAAGATFGAVEGALTGRDPFAEAVKFGTVGLLTGLGGVARQQLIAGGVLGGVVGASTAKEYGVEKGLETGSAVFTLPIVAPDALGRGLGGIAMGTTKRTAAAGLKAESIPAVETRYTQIIRDIAAQVRSGMEKKPLPGLTPEETAAIAAKLKTRPAEQREFFMQLVEDAGAKIRAGDDVALVQLSLLRDKLDPVSRMRFDEVLRQYGLAEVKHKTPEYSLREEDAPALARVFRREPEYALTDESAKLLDQLFKPKQEPQYALTDAAAQKLNLFLRRTPEYALTDEAAQRLGQFFKMRREPEYALTDEMAALLDQFLKMEPRHVLTGRVAAELAGRKAKRRLSTERTAVEPRHVLTSKVAAELVSQAKPVLTGRTALELRQEPKLASRAELELLAVQKSALAHALKQKAETVPETALTSKLRQILVQPQETGRKLVALSELLRPPRALQLLKEKPPPKERRRRAVPILLTLQVKPPQGAKPWIRAPEPFGDILKYNPPLLTTTTPPPAAYVPPTPTYTPLSVPTFTTDVPTYTPTPTPTGVPVPTYSATPVSTTRVGVPPPKDVPTVPTYDRYPRRLPYGWWRFLPPHMFADSRTGEGAYRVQEGKKQILALA